jgi:hypothetical protein
MFSLEIDTGNAAFEDSPGAEVARILRVVAERIEAGEDGVIALMDANGNKVGLADLSD